MAYAVVLVSMLLLVGLGVGIVVLEGSKRASETDKAVAAYYMANSGIEMQLYDIRKNGFKLADVGLTGNAYPGGSLWKSTTGYETTTVKVIPYLGAEELSFVDLFNPDELDVPSGVKTITVTWNSVDAACSSDLEIGYTTWSAGATVSWPEEEAVYTIAIAPYDQRTTGYDVDLPDELKSYRLRIRPFHCAVSDVRVVLKDSAGAIVPYPGEIALGSEGTYQKTTQRIRVTMPRQDILSGVFSYIIFSQEALCKRVGAAAATGACP